MIILIFSDNQCAFLYLQPTDQNRVVFNDTAVETALGREYSITPPKRPWPDASSDSNFRLCFVDYKKPRRTNFGHPEYQLLHGRQLQALITRIGACPQYVLLYSSNLPCVSPKNPIQGGYRAPRCAPLAVKVRARLARTCPDAAFYLYTDKETPASLRNRYLLPRFKKNIKKKIKALKNSDIIRIYP